MRVCVEDFDDTIPASRSAGVFNEYLVPKVFEYAN
jgi:hypothetical protein